MENKKNTDILEELEMFVLDDPPIRDKKDPVSLPLTLEEIKEERLKERELEKVAPSTGLPELDYIIRGFIPGHLYTITGETGIGKSSLASNFAVNVAKQEGKRVLYVSLEPDTTIIEFIASVYHDKRFKDLTPEDLELSGLPIDVYKKDEINSVEKMVEIIEKLPRYDLVIIDHIGYFITSQHNWIQQQSNAIKKLVSIAKSKMCAVMIIAHLRKRGRGEKETVPTPDDIAGSGAFKQDSTEVIILTRDKDPTDPDKIKYLNTGKIYVVKTKVGANGSFKIIFSDKGARIYTEEMERVESLVKEEPVVEEGDIVETAKEIFGA